ncbi:MAG: DUF4340 domain-containing protein [Armatimonadetes bacterium]|nr:DUF4340 domain-containing protein [Armatimonadota bacterium]
MKGTSTLWALVVALGLGGYVYFFERGQAPREGGARQLQQVLGYRADDVWKLELERKNDPLWLARDKARGAAAWKIEKPSNAVADGEEAGRLVKDLSEATVERVLTGKNENLAPFGLNKPAWELTIATDGGARHTLLVGGRDPGGSSLYLKRKDRDGILVMAPSTVESLQTKKAEDLKDKTVIAFEKDKVERFELTAGGKTLAVARAGADAWRITAPVKAKARTEKVNSILMTFERLKGTKFVAEDPKDLKSYGLEPPAAKVAVWVRGESAPRIGILGGKDPSNGDVYAKAAHNPAVVSVYSYIMSDAETKLEDLKEPEPVKAEKKPASAADKAPAAPPPPPAATLPANAPAAQDPASAAPANAPAPPLPTIDKPLKAAPPKEAPAGKTPPARKPPAPAKPAANAPGR